MLTFLGGGGGGANSVWPFNEKLQANKTKQNKAKRETNKKEKKNHHLDP